MLMKRSVFILTCFWVLNAHSYSLEAACTETESRTAAHDFYAVLEASRVFSVPSKEELTKIQPLVTSNLYVLLSSAVSAEEKEYNRSKGIEPPLFEGSLFSTWAEGYSNFYISNSVPKSNNTEIYVLLQYAQHLLPYYQNTPGIMEWKEIALIQREGAKCLVENIYFNHEGNSKSLQSRLKEIASFN